MDNNLISIVVPVFNTERTLDACISSLLNQTYPYLEILLINDGSTDGSLALCNKWARHDPRIYVYSQNNAGLSAARNTGIRHSHGHYIAFVDSDDIVDNSYISSLWSAATKHSGTDLVISGFKTDNPLFPPVTHPNTSITMTGHDYLVFAIRNENVCNVVAWTKLYSRRLFDTTLFPISKIHEDEYTYFSFIGNSRLVTTLPQAHYHYRFNKSGITSTENIAAGFDRVEAHADRTDYLIKHHYPTDVINISARQVLVSLLILKKQRPDVSDRYFIDMMKKRFDRRFIILYTAVRPHLSHANRLLYALFLRHPSICLTLYRIKTHNK